MQATLTPHSQIPFPILPSFSLSPGSSNTSNFPLSSFNSSAHNQQLSSSSSSSLSLSSTHYNTSTNIHNPTSFSISSPPSSSSTFSSQSHFPLDNPTNGFTSLSPSKSLNIFYFNARSLLPKFDDLLLFCAVIPLILFVLLKLGCLLRSLTLKSQYLIICYSALTVVDMVAVLQSLLRL